MGWYALDTIVDLFLSSHFRPLQQRSPGGRRTCFTLFPRPWNETALTELLSSPLQLTPHTPRFQRWLAMSWTALLALMLEWDFNAVQRSNLNQTQLQLAILLHHQHVTCRISRECLPVTAYGFATCMIFLVSSNIFKLSYLYVTSVAFKQPGCASQLSISSQASQLRILGLQRRGILTSFKTSPVNIDGRRLVFWIRIY